MSTICSRSSSPVEKFSGVGVHSKPRPGQSSVWRRRTHETSTLGTSHPVQAEEGASLHRWVFLSWFIFWQFVSHPNIQQLLAAIWYEGVPGFRRKSASQKVMIIMKVAVLFPLYCLLYMIAPETKTGKLMRKPFMKFLIHASSYLFFLCEYEKF